MAKAKKAKKTKQARKAPRRVARSAARRAAKAPPRPAARKSTGPRLSWLGEGDVPQIDGYARKLESFVDALADGVVQESELQTQEKRLVRLMKEIEPRLDNELHGRITELLCELTAYDIMQILHSMHAARPQSQFQG